MKVCHVITRLIVGGAQENTLLTCKGLSRKGCDVTLIAGPETGPEGSLWSEAKAGGYELIRLAGLQRTVHPIRDWRAAQAMTRMFQRIQPDVVHTHSSKAGILGRAAAARARVPVVVHTIHGMSFNRTQAAPTRWLFRLLERWASRRTAVFVAVADAIADQAVAARMTSRERIVTIRSGIETDRFRPDPELRAQSRRQWDVADDDVVVGTIARLFDNKGYEEIMAAMPSAVARRQELRFVWIGDGARRASYERRLDEAGLRDRVRLVGLIDPTEVATHINGFDIILHASRWEGLPRALVQGLLVEVPAISFDNDGAPEVVLPDQTGILVRLGDVAALSDAIVALSGDLERRIRFGRRGRRLCLERFGWEKMVDEIFALYGDCFTTDSVGHAVAGV